MIIDFEKIAEQHLPHFKGGELQYDAKIVDDGKVKIMSGKLVPGASIGTHTHTDSCEVIYVTSGQGVVVTPEKEEIIRAGEATYCAKGETHSLVNRGQDDLRFFAVVCAM